MAHAWLRHDLFRAKAITENPEHDWEVGAAAQAQAWGFEGPAADPDGERRAIARLRRP